MCNLPLTPPSAPSASGERDPADLPDWLHWLDSCPSTNSWAIERLPRLKHGDVVFTRRQTAGRGQHQRTWYAPEGVLTLSIILQVPRSQLAGISLVAGLAVIEAIEDLLPLRRSLRLKWPNDIYLQGRKLSGILCESVFSAEQAQVVVGIGLNRQVDWAQAKRSGVLLEQAISLHQVSPAVPEELVLLERLRHCLLQAESQMREGGLAARLAELRDRDLLIDRALTIQIGEEQIVGLGAGMDAMGRLVVRLPDGTVRSFAAGRVVAWDQEF